ncbi:hypothetical protein FHG87_003488 [Trinorchestia longiramus]|nr:hypothetical protein FHG87_003488 [Trinorchestia longiramus]
MASKLRRAPLFGIDNPLRIPSLPKYSNPAAPVPTGYKFPKSPAPTTANPIATTLPPKHTTTSSNKTQNSQASKPVLQNSKSTVADSVPTCVPEKKKRESASTESKPTAAKVSAAMQLKVAHNRQTKVSPHVTAQRMRTSHCYLYAGCRFRTHTAVPLLQQVPK